MKPIIRPLILLLFLVACGDRTQTTIVTASDSASKATDTIKAEVTNGPRIYGFDTTYEISKTHSPFMVTGYFNTDGILDTAILIRHKSTARDALYIKHGGTGRSFLLKSGNDVGTDFDDFHWVGQFEAVKKGSVIWNNVIDGEIVDETQVPGNKKITLATDAIFIHVEEASGGGFIYYSNGKYVWVQQD
jgi:hypothetical protein